MVSCRFMEYICEISKIYCFYFVARFYQKNSLLLLKKKDNLVFYFV